MREHHTTKSISFLMELIFVLFFFTIASAICVMVLVNAKEKNDEASYIRNAIFYGENLIEQKDERDIAAYLLKDRFYLDELGQVTMNPSVYEVKITRTETTVPYVQDCEMKIQVKDKEVVKLSFLLSGGEAG